ncbi:hypothetical protein PLICRDRAFT_180600 [Plicaturopsis crispa FD-325 SS-3]|uniref:CCHC-type domain-containing protein n=1 Tax=Plicaturopsis crispa FD-325 SS-3 TaxID=944288 RepID=A0A0C9SQ11_PLICR|nr:hypothetical protein PLICRDRAFT_180600 [Plicaturopsis crispa FD-325 SS-3]
MLKRIIFKTCLRRGPPALRILLVPRRVVGLFFAWINDVATRDARLKNHALQPADDYEPLPSDFLIGGSYGLAFTTISCCALEVSIRDAIPPLENLHVYLLGQMKYLWHDTNTSWNKAKDDIFADLQVLVDNVLDIWALIDPARIIKKLKLHILAHLVEHVRRFGPTILYSTEVFECWNTVFRHVVLQSRKKRNPSSWADCLGRLHTPDLLTVHGTAHQYLWNTCKAWRPKAQVGRIFKILQPVDIASTDDSVKHAVVIVECFKILDDRHQRLNMPILLRIPAETRVIQPKDVLFVFNAQHDCAGGKCPIVNTIEREVQEPQRGPTVLPRHTANSARAGILDKTDELNERRVLQAERDKHRADLARRDTLNTDGPPDPDDTTFTTSPQHSFIVFPSSEDMANTTQPHRPAIPTRARFRGNEDDLPAAFEHWATYRNAAEEATEEEWKKKIVDAFGRTLTGEARAFWFSKSTFPEDELRYDLDYAESKWTAKYCDEVGDGDTAELRFQEYKAKTLKDEDVGEFGKDALGVKAFKHTHFAREKRRLAIAAGETGRDAVKTALKGLPKTLQEALGQKIYAIRDWDAFVSALELLSPWQINDARAKTSAITDPKPAREAGSTSPSDQPTLWHAKDNQPPPSIPIPLQQHMAYTPYYQPRTPRLGYASFTPRGTPPTPSTPRGPRTAKVVQIAHEDNAEGLRGYQNACGAWSEKWEDQAPGPFNPYPITPGNAPYEDRDACDRCGKSGHFARDCTAEHPAPHLEQETRRAERLDERPWHSEA